MPQGHQGGRRGSTCRFRLRRSGRPPVGRPPAGPSRSRAPYALQRARHRIQPPADSSLLTEPAFSPQRKGRSTFKKLIPRRGIGSCTEKIASPRGGPPCRARKCITPAGNRHFHRDIANGTAGARDFSRRPALPPWGFSFLRANRAPAGGGTRFFSPEDRPPAGGRHFPRRGLPSPRGEGCRGSTPVPTTGTRPLPLHPAEQRVEMHTRQLAGVGEPALQALYVAVELKHREEAEAELRKGPRLGEVRASGGRRGRGRDGGRSRRDGRGGHDPSGRG